MSNQCLELSFGKRVVNLKSNEPKSGLAMRVEQKCRNCGIVLEEGLLGYCSSKCHFEEFVKSK